jgi:hypothetical protein
LAVALFTAFVAAFFAALLTAHRFFIASESR